ncbi:tyrosine-type recombinase/integrase [Flavobacterium sp.]|uniref:tyrosine-type recombinase/integrase n=1 Tax=Flavobacterium sp. TaxID=239 RepID=UPI00121C3BC5|nr:tyrosine-type recombinase/integrase [Flavobacterium sp.]RZJ71551.1 MAG: integrase [Flavobacterium sp.]
MASVQFRIRSKAQNKRVSIKIRLSISRAEIFEVNTGFTILPEDWSTKEPFPKKNTAENKALHNSLKELESFVYSKFNEAQSSEIVVNAYWLEQCVGSCFNRISIVDRGILINHVQYILDNAATRKVKRGGKIQLGLSKNTVKNYTIFRNLMTRYEAVIRRKIQFLEINNPFVEAFTTWLLEDQKYTVNYTGKILDMLKSVCIDADKNEIAVHKHSKTIQHFRESDEDRHIQTLSFEELEKIAKLRLTDIQLVNARNWMLIGCEIGQRGGDLLSLTPDNIRHKNDRIYIDLVQEKTGKNITIPIGDPTVKTILLKEFPFAIPHTKLNDLIKTVCEQAGITQLSEGKKLNAKTNRRELGKFPKFELISSHCFRRSFSTNYYAAFPLPLLMNITGHSKESTFLAYVNKRLDKDLEADMFLVMYERFHDERNNRLSIAK